MIGSGLDVVGLEHRRQLLHLLARQAVDDAALARVLADEAYDLLVNVLGLLPHLVVEVGTVERALELTRVLDAEAALYVGAHLVGGGGGEGYYRCHAYLFYRAAYLSVFRTEVVAPLRDAVGLVDGIERHLDLLEELYVFLLVERFGSHIQQLGMPGFHIGFHVVYGGFLERRVQVVGHAVVFADAVYHVYLVLHQRNQWRDNYGRAFHHQRRKLVAQALAASCGHEHKRVVASKHVSDYRFLVALELVETKIMFQLPGQIDFLCHRLRF